MEENTELNNYKKQIKKWEAEFFQENSKKPSKEDIQQAATDVKEAYRNYWKLRKKIDSEKDDVWNSSLNKSTPKSCTLKRSSAAERICEKIKRLSTGSIINASLLPRKKLESPSTNTIYKTQNESSLNDSRIKNCSLDISITKESNQIEDVDYDIKFEMTRTSQFVKSHDVIKKVSSVNMLSPSINPLDSAKSLRFKQDIDKDWLERCDSNILKELKEFAVAGSPISIKEPTVNFEPKSPKNSNFETSPCKDNVEVRTENFSPPKSHIEHSNLDYTIVNNQSQSDWNNTSDCMNAEDINNLKSIPTEHNATHKFNLKDKISSVSYDASKLKCEESELQHSSAKDIETEAKTEDTKKSKKRKLSCVTQVSDSVSSKKSNHLKRKIAAGTLNENFVSLNIKKKKFSRGHRQTNVRKLKWDKWKKMKNGGGGTSTTTGCFKCGQLGHWARQCNVSASIKESNAQLEEENYDDIPLPTLEEAAKLAQEAKIGTVLRPRIPKSIPTNPGKSHNVKECEEESTAHASNAYNLPQFEEADLPKDPTKPLYETSEGKPISTPKAVFDCLNEMGYSEFRNGQETAIMRVLCGLSTLVVLPTGSGKSLCYQLPAYMYAKQNKSLAIVVSPLVSLMEDQVTGLPPFLHAVCLHSGMTEAQKSNAVKDISEGVAQILLVSPEAIIRGHSFSETILNASMPPISFVCIDEVHCLSQWSHNFRPSYLQLYKVLTRKMGVKCILGLTATATQCAIEDIISHLDLKCIEESVVGCTNVPRNLLLSVSRDKDKDRALIQLLNGDRFKKCSSIIIYCIRRVETERLAALIRTCMQDELEPEVASTSKKAKTKSKKRNFAWTAEAYHAGLQPPRRRSIQKKFMTGKLRIVIATVAFGMGLDKPDVRAIIHYNMPKNFESYVQEIGRAGRDGLDSHCHVFLDSEGNDLWEQQRHIYSNGIDRHTLRKLLKRVFVPCKCIEKQESKENLQTTVEEDISEQKIECPKHEIAFTINETVQELDVKEENISTLLCYLELHPKHWIEILPPTYSMCTIRCYGGPKQMHAIALKNPAIATAIALDTERGKEWGKGSHFTFNVVEVASRLGWKAATLKRDLRRLEWNNMNRKTGVMTEFLELAFHIMAPGNLSGEELDAVLDFLHNKVVSSEESELSNLKLLFSVFQRYSSPRYWECCDEVNIEHSDGIKSAINKHFERSDLLSNDLKEANPANEEENSNEVDTTQVKSLIRDIICTHHDHNFTGRAVARIFHGISSPCYPSEVWGRVWKFWRCSLPVNFNVILKLANEELRKMR